MIKKRERKARSVPITAGCTLQWSEEGKYLTAQRKSGAPLYWSDGKQKRIIDAIRTADHFKKYVECIADMLNLEAVVVEGQHHRTYRFK